MKQKWLAIITLAGCAWMGNAARAQTAIELGNTTQFINFYTGSPAGTLDVDLGWEPGNNNPGSYTLDGALNAGSSNGTPNSWGNGSDGFALTSTDPLNLTGNGSGTFTANSGELASSAFSVTNGGSTVFQGMLTGLSFTQALSGSNMVAMQAIVDGTGSFASTMFKLVGDIALAGNGNINDLANHQGGSINEAGIIVPEPATVLLWGTGLVFLLGMGAMKRRQQFQ